MMFCSFVPVQLLVLALCSLVLARRLSGGDSLTVPTERPMLHVRPAVSDGKTEHGRDATIKLFPPSQVAFRSSSSLDCKAAEFNTITLGTDVCLSGDYYLKHNMLVTEAPICPDGSTPTLRFYTERGCVGRSTFESSVKPDPEHCLWGGIAPKYWSLIFRCGPDASSAEGADKHELAVPPSVPKPVPMRVSISSQIYSGRVLLNPECVSPRTRGYWNRPRQYLTQTDTCIVMDGDNIRIRQAAICPDGSRARWARFETTNCNGGRLSEKYGLVDIHDKDIGRDQCLITNQDKPEDKIRSVAFWCDGVKVAPPMNELSWGTYSEEACSTGGITPIFSWEGVKRVQPDTCIPKDPGTSFTVFNPGYCANATRASLAFYKDNSCSGQPDHFSEVRFNTMNTCSRFPGIGSWAFYCEGVPDHSVSIEPTPQKNSAKEGFYNREACLRPEEGRKPTPWMGFPAQAKPDTCNMQFAYPFNLSIALPATCANGTQASVALFKDESCETQPFSFRNFGSDRLNQCEYLPEVGGWAFWCDGEGLGRAMRKVELAVVLPDRIPAKLASGPAHSENIESTSRQKIEVHEKALPPGAVPDGPKFTPIVSVANVAWHPGPQRTIQFSRPVPTDFVPNHVSLGSPGKHSTQPCSDHGMFSSQASSPRSCHPLYNQHLLRIVSPAVCHDGNLALVALYQESACRGQPDHLGAVDFDSTDQSLNFEGLNSWEFSCADVGDGDVRPLKSFASKVETCAGKKIPTKVLVYSVCFLAVQFVAAIFLVWLIIRGVIRWCTKSKPADVEDVLDSEKTTEKV